MKCALICIAKNEDLYIDEWIKYHLHIGFDKIFIYRNDWNFEIPTENVYWLDISGRTRQMDAYNHWLKHFSQLYDWVAILDCDEFLNLRNSYKSVHDFFNDFSDYFAVGVNWRIFGDSGLSFDPSNTSVLKRFVRCGKTCISTIKTFLNLSKIRDQIPINQQNVYFNNPHCVNYACTAGKPNAFTIAANKMSWCNKEFNDNVENLSVQINHYHCKTREERAERIKSGRCDVPPTDPEYFWTSHDFDDYNINDIEDRTLANFDL